MIQDDEAIYGETFKKIRKSKRIKAKEAIIGACSTRTLYNFENGISCVDIATLVKLLRNINTSEEDYFDIARGHQLNISDEFFQKIVNYHREKNLHMLKEVLKKFECSDKKQHKLLILSLKTMINDLDKDFTISKKDLMAASDYLMGVEEWGYNDLGLFGQVADILSVDLSISIAKGLIKKNIYGDEKRERRIIRILLNVSYSCIKHERLEDAENFLKKAEILIKAKRTLNVVGELLVLKFMQGFYLLIKENNHSGMTSMLRSIEGIKLTEDEEIILQYETYYDEAYAQAKKLFKEEYKKSKFDIRLNRIWFSG